MVVGIADEVEHREDLLALGLAGAAPAHLLVEDGVDRVKRAKTRLTTSGQSKPVSSMFTETRICGNVSFLKRLILVMPSTVSSPPMPETT